MSTDSERIDALETHLAFQDDMIQQLNDALVAQQGRIDQLQAEVAQLTATLGDATNGAQGTPADERPPHY